MEITVEVHTEEAIATIMKIMAIVTKKPISPDLVKTRQAVKKL